MKKYVFSLLFILAMKKNAKIILLFRKIFNKFFIISNKSIKPKQITTHLIIS